MLSRLLRLLGVVGQLVAATPLEDATGFIQRSTGQLSEVADTPELTVDFQHPMKTLVGGIDAAIAEMKVKYESRTKEVVHRTSSELRALARQLSAKVNETVHEAIVQEVAKFNRSSLLELSGDAAPPEDSRVHQKKPMHFNPFDVKGLVATIDSSIDPLRANLEMGTRVLIHDAQDELTRIGEKLSQSLQQSLHTAVQEAIREQVLASQQTAAGIPAAGSEQTEAKGGK